MTTFASLGLDPRLCAALEKVGFTTPTPIQEQSIPQALSGKDVMASAQTGTGKTAAFVLPSLHRIIAGPSQVKGHGPRMLVLTPTRELAMQVLENIRTASHGVRVSTGVMVGGVAYGPQMGLLRNPLDVLVSTPGRLIDHMNEGRVDFSRMEVLVLDEADKMLDMGFLKPVEKVLSAVEHVASRPQILLFSATFTKSVEQFAGKYLRSPARSELAPKKMNHDQIEQRVYRADNADHKYALLEVLLEEARGERVLVFSATKYGSERLAKKLVAAGYTAEALHGGMKQNVRKRTLGKMHTGDVQVLVATDVAARGIDVKQLGHVINIDLPQVAEDYVHRIGRTGRAGAMGIAISLVSPEDVPMLKDIEKVIGKEVAFLEMKGFEPQMSLSEFNRLGAAAPRSRQKSKSGGRSFGPREGGDSPRGGRAAPSSSSRFGARREGGYRDDARRDDSRRDGGRREDSRGGRSEGGFSSPRPSRDGARVGRFDRAPERASSRSEGERSFSARPARGNDSRREDSRGGRSEGSSSRFGKPSGGASGKAFGDRRPGQNRPSRAPKR